MTHLLTLAAALSCNLPVSADGSAAAPARIFASPNGTYGLRVVANDVVVARTCDPKEGDGGRVVESWSLVERTGRATLFTLDPAGNERPVWTAPTSFPGRVLIGETGRFVVAVTAGGEEHRDRTILCTRPSVVIYGAGGKPVATLRPDDVLDAKDRRDGTPWTDGVEFRLDEPAGELVVAARGGATRRFELATGRRVAQK